MQIWDRFGPARLVSGRSTDDAGGRGRGNTPGVVGGICRSANLRGRGPVPEPAGRSPSYPVRQLHDMQPGTRKRIWTDPMKGVAGELTDEEMIVIGAYLASSKS